MATANSINLSGKKIGYLEVVEVFRGKVDSKHKGRYWTCRCECGVEKIVPQVTLTTPDAKPSCGCRSRDTVSTLDGLSVRNHRVYHIYQGMLRRCATDGKGHPRYAGRGITVCERWLGDNGFKKFLEDMGQPLTTKHEIERQDNDKGYSPDNCRWATHQEQMRNTARNVFYTHDGVTLCVTDWAKRLGISRKTLDKRFVMGWSVERALSSVVSKTHAENAQKRLVKGVGGG